MPGPLPKVPPALHALVLKLAGEGKASEEIRAQLWLEHKLDVSARAVRRLIERHRTEQADVAKAVVRDELRKHLLPLVRRAARAAQHAEVLERRARVRAQVLRTEVHANHPLAMNEDVLVLKAIDRQLKAANLLLHYAGLNQPDAPGAAAHPAQDPRAALLKRLQELAAAPEPGPKDPSVH